MWPKIHRETLWLDDDCTDAVTVRLVRFLGYVWSLPAWIDDWLIPALWVRPFVDEDAETAGCEFTFFWLNRVIFCVERYGNFPGLRVHD